MNIYNVTKSSYPLFDQGLTLCNEGNHEVRSSKYVDQPFGELIATTRKELIDWYRENVLSKLEPTLAESDPVEYHYRMFGGRGQKLYYWEGKHYTYEEYYPIMLREANKALAKAGNLVEDGWMD